MFEGWKTFQGAFHVRQIAEEDGEEEGKTREDVSGRQLH